jgi:predicted short-subunit dehydrogenase-like oxidoreductase (DUF2520 family)
MDIVLIGSGNVATVLGRKSLAAGHRIVQVYSPHSGHANELAVRLGTNSTSYISSIEKKADLTIVALRDDAVSSFVQQAGKINSILVHTAGSLSINVLKGASNQSYGVLYPLQSLKKEIDVLPQISILVDGNNPVSLGIIKEFAQTIAEMVSEADDGTRLKYHLAATIVNNFTNYLFTLAASFCEKENISFSVLQPLIEETVLRLRKTAPQLAQTGAAIRSDVVTIQKHQELLEQYPHISKFYNLFTEEIQQSVSGIAL